MIILVKPKWWKYKFTNNNFKAIMREIFTDKKFRVSKILLLIKIVLVIALIVFFLPLLILPFFNHAFADDYYCGHQVNISGFTGFQSFMYFNWSGRFATTFLWSLFEHNNFLYTHYYFYSLLLSALDFVSIFFLINTVCKYILKERGKFSNTIILAFLFLALEVCCLPQVSTFLFWFSSAVTYLFPLILFQSEIALFIIFFNTDNKVVKNICAIVLPLVVFIMIGFNELFVVVQLFLFGAGFYFKWYKQCSVSFIAVMITAFAAASAIVVLAPGNKIRMDEIESKSILTGFIAVVFNCLEALWSIFKNPFAWFILISSFFYGMKRSNQWQGNIYIQKIARQKWLLAVVLIFFLLITISLPVIAVKGGMVPDRYLNIIVCFMLMLMILFAFISGIITNLKILLFQSLIKKIISYVFLIIGLFANTYIVDAYKSIIIAPAYNIILNEREAVLKQPTDKNKVAMVKDYNTALQELLQTKYKASTATLQQVIRQKPPLLFFEDDLATDYSIDVLKKFYGLDSIIIKKN